MNRKLSYNGKTVPEMTTKELQEQYKTNKNRLKVRSGFLGGVSILAFFAMPILAIVPIGVGVITGYWLVKNNEAIKEEIDRR